MQADCSCYSPDDEAGVARLAGANAFATAAELSQRAFPDGANQAYVASRRDFPDALAGGAHAFVTDQTGDAVALDD